MPNYVQHLDTAVRLRERANYPLGYFEQANVDRKIAQSLRDAYEAMIVRSDILEERGERRKARALRQLARATKGGNLRRAMTAYRELSPTILGSPGKGLASYPRVYLLRGDQDYKPGYYYVIARSDRGEAYVRSHDGGRSRKTKPGELAYALARTPRGGGPWFLASSTRSVKPRSRS